ncbi:hypothetical protein V5O48_013838, partial [Marasmius crinis-equi]
AGSSKYIHNPPGGVSQSKKPTLDWDSDRNRQVQVDEAKLVESWDVFTKEIEKYDQEMFKSWTKDLNILLVFAGLLSIVATMFTIESYQWLREDPANVTVALLAQISQQIAQPNLLLPTKPQSQQSFYPAPSSVRINCFWFLSLILSLATGLLSLLCKQWLHEARETPTSMPRESLAIRHMRHDSFDKGKVPLLIATLPVLLEIALLLFFAGLLDFFGSLDIQPLFVVGCISIGASGLLYLITTIMPGLAVMEIINREILRLNPRRNTGDLTTIHGSAWSYKSPQAWAFFKVLSSSAEPGQALERTMEELVSICQSWAHTDLMLLKSQRPEIGNQHLWKGIRSVIPRLKDTVSLQPHLRRILQSFSLKIALPLGFPEYYRLYTWIESSMFRIDTVFPSVMGALDNLGIPLQDGGVLTAPPVTKTMMRIVTNNSTLDSEHLPEDLFPFLSEAREISKGNIPTQTGINFTLFFQIAERVWEGSRGVELLNIYKDEWIRYSNFVALNYGRILVAGDERYQFIASFARYINTRLDLPEPRDTEPVLLTEKGCEFLHYIHNQIIKHKLYNMARYRRIVAFPVDSTSQIINNWMDAMKVVQQMKELPNDYFVEFPSYD